MAWLRGACCVWLVGDERLSCTNTHPHNRSASATGRQLHRCGAVARRVEVWTPSGVEVHADPSGELRSGPLSELRSTTDPSVYRPLGRVEVWTPIGVEVYYGPLSVHARSTRCHHSGLMSKMNSSFRLSHQLPPRRVPTFNFSQ